MPPVYQRLGRYLITEEIASGGMATVYRGKLLGVEGFQKDVAIKKILPRWTGNTAFVSMLIDEAKTLVHLQHKNIAQVIELAKEKDTYFIVMEYVAGVDLRSVLQTLKRRDETLPLPLTVFVIKEICSALSFAHNRCDNQGQALGIVHRDVSPQNILISDSGEVKLTDFGIAKIVGKTSETAAGALKGKFVYMSPEQACGSSVDARSDLFSLGSVFFELLLGCKPFDASSDPQILENVKLARYELPDRLNPLLKSFLNKCLACDVEDRFASAQVMKQELETLENQLEFRATESDLMAYLQTRSLTKPSVPELFQNQGEDETRLFETEGLAAQNLQTLVMPARFEQTSADAPTVIATSFGQESESLDFELSELVTNLPEQSPSIWPRVVVALLIPFVMTGLLFLKAYFSAEPEVMVVQSEDLKLSPDSVQTLPVLAQGLPLSEPAVPQEQKTPKKVLGKVKLDVDPHDARVVVKQGDALLSFKGFVDQEFRFEEGDVVPMTVSISAPGYQNLEQQISLSSSEPVIHQSFKLKPLGRGEIEVSVRPLGRVQVENYGSKSSSGRFELPEGQHVVTVHYPPLNKTLKQTVFVKADQKIRCRASFGKTRFLECR